MKANRDRVANLWGYISLLLQYSFSQEENLKKEQNFLKLPINL